MGPALSPAADHSAIYQTPVDGQGPDVPLLGAWLSSLRSGREIGGYFLRLSVADQVGLVLIVTVSRPSPGAAALIDMAFEVPGRAQLLACLWALPSSADGLARDLERPRDEMLDELHALERAGVAYEVDGIWRARPLQRGGKA